MYGEANHSLVVDLIRHMKITSTSIFIDLGSGIGNVVLQVSAQTQCKAYGIELLPTPANMAKAQLKEFRTRMKCYGRTVSSTHLKKGDFLDDIDVHKILQKADAIFVNNYAFGSELNNKLLHMFLSLKEGARIMSLLAFRPLEFKITEHNMHDMAAILTVKKYGYIIYKNNIYFKNRLI